MYKVIGKRRLWVLFIIFFSILISQQVIEAYSNLLSNPSFEIDEGIDFNNVIGDTTANNSVPDGWTKMAGNPVYDTLGDYSYHGKCAIKVKGSSDTIENRTYDVSPGMNLSLSLYAKGVNGGERVRIQLAFFDSNGNWISTLVEDFNTTVTTAYKRLTYTCTAPANTYYARLTLEASYNSNEEIWYDAAILEKGSVSSDYSNYKSPINVSIYNTVKAQFESGEATSTVDINTYPGNIELPLTYTNLLPNTSFEVNNGTDCNNVIGDKIEGNNIPDGWAILAGNPVYDTSGNYSYHRNAAVKVTGSSNAIETRTYSISPGMNLLLSLYAKGVNGGEKVRIQLAFFNSNGNWISTPIEDVNTTVTAVYQRLEYTCTAPANTYYARLTLEAWYGTGEQVWYDAIVLREDGNLFPNPDFELNDGSNFNNVIGDTTAGNNIPDGWAILAGSPVYDTSGNYSYHGRAAVKVTGSSDSIETRTYSVTPGMNLSLSLYAKGVSGGEKVRIQLAFFNSNGNWISTPVEDVNTTVTAAYQRLEYTCTAPANTYYARLTLEAWYNSSEQIWYDAVDLKKPPYSSAFADYKSSGTFISHVFDMGFYDSLGTIIWTGTTAAATTTVTVQTRTGDVSDTSDSSWTSWSTETTGTVITSPKKRYLQYKVALSTTDSTKTPILHDIKINYKESQPYGFLDALNNATEIVKVKDAGMRWARFDFTWNNIEPSNGNFTWSNHDSLVLNAEKANVQILGILDYCALWASSASQGASNRDKYPPSNLSDWEDYVTQVVSRYKGRVSCWEVWNEPDSISFWHGTVSQYVDLLKKTYSAVKTIDPDALVIGCVTSGVNLKWIEDVLKTSNGFKYMDGISIHPYVNRYSPEEENLVTHIIQFRALIDKYGGGKRIWLSENGIRADNNPYTEEEQANYLVRTYVPLMANNLADKQFWFKLYEGPNYDRTGILTHPNYNAKPAYTAYKVMTKELQGTRYLNQRSMSSFNEKVYVFEKGNRRTFAVWHVTGSSSVDIEVSGSNCTLVTRDGQESNLPVTGGKVTVTSSESPQYIKELVDVSIIKGTVKDGAGVPVEAAVVSPGVSDGYTTVTDKDGNYSLYVPAGNYTVTASKSWYGFGSGSSGQLSPGQTATVNLTMQTISTPNRNSEGYLWKEGESYTDGNGSMSYSVDSNASGGYYLSGLDANGEWATYNLSSMYGSSHDLWLYHRPSSNITLKFYLNGGLLFGGSKSFNAQTNLTWEKAGSITLNKGNQLLKIENVSGTENLDVIFLTADTGYTPSGKIVPQSPGLSWPVLRTINNNVPTLRWKQVHGFSTYTLQYDIDSAFGSPTTVANITSNSYQIPSALTDNKTWYWRIKTTDTGSNTGPYSAAASFYLLTTATLPSIEWGENINAEDDIDNSGSPDNWINYSFGPNPGTISWDGNVAHQGKYSLAISGTGTSTDDNWGKQNAVRVTAGNAYVLSGWVKTASLGGTAHIFINWTKEDGSVVSSGSSTLTGTNGWTLLTVTAQAPATAHEAGYALKVDAGNGTGTAWLDDISFGPQ